jgi:predicted enzyme related to lactoylglutathione lyase
MPTRDTPFTPGTPCWVDLTSSDIDATKTFYGGLFGWAFEEGRPEFGGYTTATSDGHRVAGLMPRMPEMQGPDVWTTYIATADAAATAQAITDNGGQAIAPPMEVADIGTMAVAVDPAGGLLGVWQPGSHTGFGKYNEPGSVSWAEHHSKDFAASTPFYETVFGWTMDKSTGDTDDFRYYVAQVDGEGVAGLMDSASFLPAEAPSHWAVYFSVADADEAAGKVTELGGTVLRGPEDTPFGRMADAVDSAGVPFKLHSEKLANPQPS